RLLQVAPQVDGRVAEELLALARGTLEGLLQLLFGLSDAEALAAASAHRLGGDRIADLGGLLTGVLAVLRRLGQPRHDRDARLLHQLAGAGLRAHRLDRLG